MKSFSSTAIFAIIVVIVCGLAYWELDRSESEKKTQAEVAKALPYWQVDEVNELRIVNDKQKLHLKISNDNWQLISPVTDLADESSVTSMISAMLADNLTKLDTEGVVNWTKYGLEQGKRFVEINSSKNKKEKLFVSTKKSYDGKRYLKYESKDGLYIGSATWDNWLNRKANEIRNKKLFSNFEKIKHLTISEGKKSISFEHKASEWVVDGDDKYPVDMEKVKSLISSIQNFRASDVVAEEKSKEIEKKFKLLRPQISLVIKTDEGQDIEIFVGKKSKKDVGDVYLHMSHRPYVYKTTDSVVDKWKVAKADFLKVEEKKENKESKDSQK